MFLLPLPGPAQELLAAQVVPGKFFLLAQRFFHGRLRGEARVVGAGQPEHFVAGLAGAAGEDVLDRVVEDVPEGQHAGDVRRRDDDRKTPDGRRTPFRGAR